MSIYFIGYGDLVKIGFTEDLRARFAALQTMVPVPLTFIGHMPGDKAVEAHLHTLFADARSNGEWFSCTDKVQQFVELVLVPGLPERPRVMKTAPMSEATKREWHRYGAALRADAVARWPDETHRHRVALITEGLGWKPRRVRSLYDRDGFGRLTATEANALTAWIAPEWFQLEQENEDK